MPENLLKSRWKDLDSAELRILLDERVGGPGQYDAAAGHPNKLYLPLARSSCRIALTFRNKRIFAIESGEAFDAAQWEQISNEIENSILAGPMKVGREYSFSGRRVSGSWRRQRSGVQILPPPADAPRAPVEMADHPFILEFPLRSTDLWEVMNHRRIREHSRLTLLLNVLLAGGAKPLESRSQHFWAAVDSHQGYETKWVQKSFFAKLGPAVTDELSAPAAEQLEEVEPDEYYARVGHDGKGLRVPSDLDESICSYAALSALNREEFNRATFWMGIASRMWDLSMSSSFAALVSAIESLTERGDVHPFTCPICSRPTQHEVPGATQRFRDFVDTFAPGAALSNRRNEMYRLRSDILHGSDLIQMDEDRAFGWDPPWWNERELYNELWGLTRIALRNWLKRPPAS